MSPTASCVPSSCQQIPSALFSTLPTCAETTPNASFEDFLTANGLPPPGTWSWDWFTFPVPDSTYETYVTGYAAGAVLAGIMLVALSYPLLDRIWSSQSEKFRNLPNEQQVVVIQHSIEAFFLALVFVPVTWSMLSLNFQVPQSEKFGEVLGSVIGMYMIWIVTTYFVELAARYKNIRPLVLVHHLCAAANALLPLFTMTLVNIRCASVLTYFITFESPVFAGLVMYRLFPLQPWTPRMIRLGMWVFGLTRPLQMAWILIIVFEHWETSQTWQCIVQILFGFLFSSLQLYTLVIHNFLLKKCLRSQQEARKEATTESSMAEIGFTSDEEGGCAMQMNTIIEC